MTGSQVIGLVTIVCLFGGPMIVGVVYAIANSWAKAVRDREDADLKHRMVDAGFSVEEIERVLNAGRGGNSEPKDQCTTKIHVA